MPVTYDREKVKVKPIAILDKKPMKKGNQAVVMRLIQWLNLIKKDITWEEFKELSKQFSEFNIDS